MITAVRIQAFCLYRRHTHILQENSVWFWLSLRDHFCALYYIEFLTLLCRKSSFANSGGSCVNDCSYSEKKIWRQASNFMHASQYQISARRPAILTDGFRGFHQYLEEDTRIYLKLCHDRFLHIPFVFNFSSYHSTLCII
jgi:hypothetical protein